MGKILTKDEIIQFIYDVIKCKGKSPSCIGKDCDKCKAEKLAYFIN